MNSDFWYGIIGGALIGSSIVGLMLTHGRVAGLSEIMRAALWSRDRYWRIMFLLGIVFASSVFYFLVPGHIEVRQDFPLLLLATSGLIVGIGVTIGSGCTSGHGICGLSRFSKRSVFASLTFFVSAVISRFVFHNWLVLAP